MKKVRSNLYASTSLPYLRGGLFVGGAAMTTEVKQFLIDRDMRTVEFARLFNISHRTVIYWSMGHKEPPFSAIALIRAIQSGALDIDWLRVEGDRVRGWL